MKKRNKKYLVVYDRIDYFGKYCGQMVRIEDEKGIKEIIKDKFSKKYWTEFYINKIYEIKEDVTIQMLEEVNSKMKYNRDEKKISDTFCRAKCSL